MSFLERLLGLNRSGSYDEGLALLEEGRFAEAAEILRRAVGSGALDQRDSLGGDLLRRSLLGEGRRLARRGACAEALPFFREAADLWPDFPDLHWLQGVNAGLAGDWEAALRAALAALRLNADYAEARCLQAAALQQLGRGREAAQALADLQESGRRNDHWLTRKWPQQPAEDNLPEDLVEVLQRLVSGESEKEQLASAVALCRAGQWENGLAAFRELTARRPQYPDYRTRLAAALFQVRRCDEALAEVEAALAIHPSYRLAIDLKALVLADRGAYRQAWNHLQETERNHKMGKSPNAHEALFGAYLRGVLALLLGRPDQVGLLLDRWRELAKNFAWAEVLLAAADDLRGQHTMAAQRLDGLCRQWPGESDYVYLLACHQLTAGRLAEAAQTLQNWPPEDGEADLRPLYLQALIQLRQGRTPRLPDPLPTAEPAGLRFLRRILRPPAWELLQASADFLAGQDAECWQRCEYLAQDGLVSEQSLRIQVQAASGAAGVVPANWRPAPVTPDSCLPGVVSLAWLTGDDQQGRTLVRRHADLHPESLQGVWLTPEFWLEPVRGWIA